MIKNLTRMILGLALFPLAVHLHREAINWGNRSLGAYVEGDPLPQAGDYFGPDPDEYAKTPESKSLRNTGYALELVASIFDVASPVLIVLGITPYFFSVLRSLFIPNFMKRRLRNDPAVEMAPETSPTDSDGTAGQDPV